MELKIIKNEFGKFDVRDIEHGFLVDIDFDTEKQAETWIEWTFFKDIEGL